MAAAGAAPGRTAASTVAAATPAVAPAAAVAAATPAAPAAAAGDATTTITATVTTAATTTATSTATAATAAAAAATAAGTMIFVALTDVFTPRAGRGASRVPPGLSGGSLFVLSGCPLEIPVHLHRKRGVRGWAVLTRPGPLILGCLHRLENLSRISGCSSILSPLDLDVGKVAVFGTIHRLKGGFMVSSLPL